MPLDLLKTTPIPGTTISFGIVHDYEPDTPDNYWIVLCLEDNWYYVTTLSAKTQEEAYSQLDSILANTNLTHIAVMINAIPQNELLCHTYQILESLGVHGATGDSDDDTNSIWSDSLGSREHSPMLGLPANSSEW